MNVIETAGSVAELQRLLSSNARADYVYMYPPRQAYRRQDEISLTRVVTDSLARRAKINLYFHFPFCRQICSFCNLYAMTGEQENAHIYVDSLLTELRHYAPLIVGRRIDTLYLGGGTPSLFDADVFSRLFREIFRLGLGDIENIPEVAIEAAPDTVTTEKFRAFHDIGINRVNVGVQSVQNAELALIGRAHGSALALNSLDTLQRIGFKNVCVDLIYGLEGQSDEMWERSVQTVADLRPNTICAYPLTLRPRTGFAARGYTHVNGESLYGRYDIVHQTLLAAGYSQETHVRWVLDDAGGYRQKSNHWAGDDIVGIGAGARGYLQFGDYRNGYSIRNRRRALEVYVDRVRHFGHGRSEGFRLDEDERRRRTMILGLGNLDRLSFLERHGIAVESGFGTYIEALLEIGALSMTPSGYALTNLGQKYRDVLVQPLFSQRVMTAVSQFDYDE